MKETLNVKVGDKVLRHDRWNGDCITEVIKITPTGNIRTSSGNYYTPDGRIKSSDPYSVGWIKELTAEDEEKLKMKSIKRMVAITNYNDLPDEKIIAIYEILKGDNNESNTND